MANERWHRAARIFDSALECAPGARRAALLDAECGADDALRREVESLLAAHEEAQSFLAGTPFELPLAQVLGGASVEPAGRQLGAYRLVRELGRGGMGAVFLAERADEQYEQHVAIKVVKRGMDSDAILSRFRHERQILAALDHPNIARLLDGGTTAEGLPYFVMEYIEGLPVDEYCEAHALSVRARLKLFQTVCAAVHYAHQNLVVHRDIKPSNILVTPDGVPKLLDFGIAKLLKPELYAQTVAPTATSERPMTPDYASPEQVRGLPVTTASDVYALGALLYELLTGQRPHRLHSYTTQEIERVICEQEPERPSEAVTAGRQRRAAAKEKQTAVVCNPKTLRGDLDNIVLMALRKEPQRRYASAQQLADDIERHLTGRPVIARKDTLGYRVGKFVRRNKVAVSAAAALLLVLLAAGVVVALQSARVARERDRAQRERERAEKVSAFLVNLFKVSDPDEAKGHAVTAREMLDQGAARIEHELQDQPEVQATLMDTMGSVYETLGLYHDSETLLARALGTRRALYGEDHPEVIKTLQHLALLQRQQGDFAGAEASWRAVIAGQERLHGKESAEVAEALNELGKLFWWKGDLVSAEPFFREALAIRRKVYGNNHPSVAKSLNNVAVLLNNKGDYEAAEPLYREALALQRRLLGDENGDTASMMVNLGDFLADHGGKFDEAEALMRAALDIRRKLFGPDHLSVLLSLRALAGLCEAKRDYARAVEYRRDELAMARRLYGSEAHVGESCRYLALSLAYYAGDHASAEPLLREGLAIQRKVIGDAHPETNKSLSTLGYVLYLKGDLPGAEAALRQALAAQRSKVTSNREDFLNLTLITLGRVLTERGAAREAEPLLREALQTLANPTDYWDRDLKADARSALGGCLVVLRRYDEAEPLLRDSYPALLERAGEHGRAAVLARKYLFQLYQGLRRPDEAARYR